MPANDIPQKTIEQKKQVLKNNKKPITQYLVNFQGKFGDQFSSLDDIWNEVDVDQNGHLEEAEALDFIKRVSKIIN